MQVNTHTPVLSCVNPLKKGWDIAGALDAYEAQGAPMSKIVFGLATHGRGFRFSGDDTAAGVGTALDPAEGEPLRGECTQTNYTLAWYEVKKVADLIIIDPVQMAAYGVTTSGHWVGFDTVDTHRMKMCYARARGISGIMVWDADMDDQMELIRSINENMADECKDFSMPKC
jgi:chitinase